MRDTVTPGSVLKFIDSPDKNILVSSIVELLRNGIENLAKEFELTADWNERQLNNVKPYAPSSASEHYEAKAKAFRAAAKQLRKLEHLPFQFEPIK